MASEQIWQRSEIMGTQVITRTSGRRLGIVAEILVDVDRREVVAFGLRDNLLTKIVPGVPRYMYLSSIKQVGDVILVESDDAIQDIDIAPYTSMTNSEVITEAGDPLGRVRGFQFNIETGHLESLVIASIGMAIVPEQVLSTYNLPIDEIVSSGPDRIIVFEGAEERLQQLSVGVLERLGIGNPPWEKDDNSYVLPTISAENQLGTGLPTQQQPQRQSSAERDAYGRPYRQSPVEETWDEDYREEPEPILREERRPEPQRRYMEAEPERAVIPSSGWSDTSNQDRYQQDRYQDDDGSDDGDHDGSNYGDERGREADEYGNDPYAASPLQSPTAEADDGPVAPEDNASAPFDSSEPESYVSDVSSDAWADEAAPTPSESESHDDSD